MKKWFLMAPAMLFAIFSCSNDPKDNETKDSVSIFPNEDQIIESTGDNVSVQVTSSGDWTLAPDTNHDWVSADKLQGKDGDTVLFTVLANDDAENNQEAIYTFKVGKAEAKLKIILKKKEPSVTKLNLLSEADVKLTNVKQEFPIKLDTEVAYRELEQVISPASAIYHKDDNPDGWISFNVTLKEDDVVSMMFNVLDNPGFENRSAEITITGGVDGKAVVNVTQSQTDRLVAEEIRLLMEQAGGTVTVKFVTNVEYEVSLDDVGKTWLTMGTATTDSEGVTSIPFSATGIAADAPSRGGQVTISQKDGDLKQVVSITQKGATMIDKVANMNKNWAWCPTWNNNTPLRNLADFTFEALVNANAFTKTVEEHGTLSKLSTVGGIEGGKFMLRFGDETIATNQLQVIYPNGTNDGDKKASTARFETGEWLHLAVTFHTSSEPRFGKVYVNGVEQTEMAATTPSTSRTVDFGLQINGNEGGWNQPRRFWIGYAWDENRFFDALFSEVRIWNKALSEEELNATDHFYSVAPNAEGLVAYWKFDDDLTGTDGIIKDSTSNANHMTTKSEVTWVSVAL